jgi:hypothetical protein
LHTAVLFGVFVAYPPLGTTPGVPERELAAVLEISINPLGAFLETNWWLGTAAFLAQLAKLTRLVL